MRRIRDERGQALVFAVILMTVFLGLAGLTLDVGNKYRKDRQFQSVADAAALAAAQDLPDCPTKAQSDADSSISSNGGGATFSINGDSIQVTARGTSPGIFTSLVGVSAFDTGADATAKAYSPSSAKYVRPLAFVEDAVPTPNCNTLLDPAANPQSNFDRGTFYFVDFTGNLGQNQPDKWVASMLTTNDDGGWQQDLNVGSSYPVVNAKPTKGETCQALSALADSKTRLRVPIGVYESSSQTFTIRSWGVFVVTHPDATQCIGGGKKTPAAPARANSSVSPPATVTPDQLKAMTSVAPPVGTAHTGSPAAAGATMNARITGPNSALVGDTFAYTVSITGSCSGTAGYAWSITNGTGSAVILGSTTSSSATVNFTGAGTISVGATVTKSGCVGQTASDSVPVTVRLPSITGVSIGGSSRVNVGDVLPYTFSSTGTCDTSTGATYAWSVTNGTGAAAISGPNTGASANVSFSGAGTVTVNVTVTKSTCSGSPATASMSVVVSALTIGNVSIRASSNAPTVGDTVTYSASNTGRCANVAYLWSVTNGTGSGSISGPATGSSADVVFTAGGTLTIGVTLTQANCSDSPQLATKAVTVTKASIGNVSISGPGSVNAGDTDQYTVSYTGKCSNTNMTYAWTVNNSNASITGASDQAAVTLDFNNPGTVILDVTLTDSDCADSPQAGSQTIRIGTASIGKVTIDSGPTITYVGETDAYTSKYVGRCSNFTYQWTVAPLAGGAAHIAGAADGSSVNVGWDSVGTVRLTVTISSPDCSGSPASDSATITINKPRVGTISVSGNPAPGVGGSENYAVSFSGACTPVTYHWSVPPGAQGHHPDGQASIVPPDDQSTVTLKLVTQGWVTLTVSIGWDPSVCDGRPPATQDFPIEIVKPSIAPLSIFGPTDVIVNDPPELYTAITGTCGQLFSLNYGWSTSDSAVGQLLPPTDQSTVLVSFPHEGHVTLQVDVSNEQDCSDPRQPVTATLRITVTQGTLTGYFASETCGDAAPDSGLPPTNYCGEGGATGPPSADEKYYGLKVVSLSE